MTRQTVCLGNTSPKETNLNKDNQSELSQLTRRLRKRRETMEFLLNDLTNVMHHTIASRSNNSRSLYKLLLGKLP